MKPDPKITEESGLRFFGRVTASISHEIKNVLAIINENAGLLEDLALMTEKGQPLDPGRVKALSGKVRNQVRRGDEIVTNMNRFAHSVDEPVEKVDLSDIVDLMTRLAQRIAATKKINLEWKAPATPVSIFTRPFLLENVIWLCLILAMDAVGEANTIELIVESTATGTQIRFSGLRKEMLPLKEGLLSKGETHDLLGALGADCAVESEAGEVILRFPDSVP